MPREHKSQGIVLTIACIGELYLAKQRSKESTGSPQTIDAQGIVRPILVGPLPMVYQSGRKGIQLEIAHAIRAYHHRCILLMEGIDHLLEGARRRIKVVTVELHSKTSAMITIDGNIPTAANAQVSPFWNDMNQAGIMDFL